MDSSVSYAKTIKFFTLTGLAWVVVASVFGLMNQMQLLSGAGGPLSYGVLRPLYTTVLLFGGFLSLFLAAAYYLVQKSQQIQLQYEFLGLISWAILQGAVLLGVATIVLGWNKGREYGEMSVVSDQMLALSLVVFLVSILIGIRGANAQTRTVAIVLAAMVGGIAVYFLGNIGVPYGPFSIMPLHSGFQDAAVQEFYRTGLLTFFILLPLFAVLYFFIPSYYKVNLYSEKTLSFQLLAMIALGSLGGGAGLIFSPAPLEAQTLGVIVAPAFAVAVLAGGFNLNTSLSRSGEKVNSDSVGLFFRIGLYLMVLWAVLRALASTRFMQNIMGYTWWNPQDLSLDAQTYGLLILFGAAYVYTQRVTGQSVSGALTSAHLWTAVIGAVLIIFSDVAQGLLTGFKMSAMDAKGALQTSDWSAALYAGSLASPDAKTKLIDPGSQFLLSPRGLNFIGSISLFVAACIGALNIGLTFSRKNKPYEEPSLRA